MRLRRRFQHPQKHRVALGVVFFLGHGAKHSMAKYKNAPHLRPPPTPPAPQFWDRPKTPAKGDKRERNTFAAVGSALTEWERLEHQLGELFVALVSSRSNEARRAYSAVIVNSARLTMIAAATEVFFLHRTSTDMADLQKRLTKLVNTVEQIAARRNEIAHGVVTFMLDDKDGDAPPSFVLGPSFYAYRQRQLFAVSGTTSMIGLSPLYQYSSAEIDELSNRFQILRQVATKITLAVRRQRHLESKASSQKPA